MTTFDDGVSLCSFENRFNALVARCSFVVDPWALVANNAINSIAKHLKVYPSLFQFVVHISNALYLSVSLISIRFRAVWHRTGEQFLQGILRLLREFKSIIIIIM